MSRECCTVYQTMNDALVLGRRLECIPKSFWHALSRDETLSNWQPNSLIQTSNNWNTKKFGRWLKIHPKKPYKNSSLDSRSLLDMPITLAVTKNSFTSLRKRFPDIILNKFTTQEPLCPPPVPSTNADLNPSTLVMMFQSDDTNFCLHFCYAFIHLIFKEIVFTILRKTFLVQPFQKENVLFQVIYW